MGGEGGRVGRRCAHEWVPGSQLMLASSYSVCIEGYNSKYAPISHTTAYTYLIFGREGYASLGFPVHVKTHGPMMKHKRDASLNIIHYTILVLPPADGFD